MVHPPRINSFLAHALHKDLACLFGEIRGDVPEQIFTGQDLLFCLLFAGGFGFVDADVSFFDHPLQT